MSKTKYLKKFQFSNMVSNGKSADFQNGPSPKGIIQMYYSNQTVYNVECAKVI